MNAECTPDKCQGCTGCGGEAIEKITIRVEWKHKGITPEDPDEVNRMMDELAGELIVSSVELIYINNTFGADIGENSSDFFINSHPLSDLVSLPSDGPVHLDLLRKGIFQVLLRNL